MEPSFWSCLGSNPAEAWNGQQLPAPPSAAAVTPLHKEPPLAASAGRPRSERAAENQLPSSSAMHQGQSTSTHCAPIPQVRGRGGLHLQRETSPASCLCREKGYPALSLWHSQPSAAPWRSSDHPPRSNHLEKASPSRPETSQPEAMLPCKTNVRPSNEHRGVLGMISSAHAGSLSALQRRVVPRVQNTQTNQPQTPDSSLPRAPSFHFPPTAEIHSPAPC